MTKRIKFLLGFIALSLGFLFCFSFTVSVSANDGTETTTDETTETTSETTDELTQEETEAVVDLFLDHLQNLKWEEAEAVFGWLIGYLIANFGVIALFVIKMILEKLKETKSTDAYNKALAKLSVEHQQKMEELTTNFTNTLETLKADFEEQNKETQARLEALSNDNTKEIAKACASITENLNK